ncbi:tRNA pseudouridine(55) synthase TruB [Microaerobacter geothermalis]|uniref:tRNA pseudouridine(55) synthase TruB n=1 Tax=Microaerobacter geothermalis TaxID=674972 RepID=UPI001F248318|nr:tRNA pseudouridine(55) synthase TruB [Microaerobacter geothermalis]MCF6093187.1 tRNA pseudouridine(55) synthase TruB [Microaerobacter geothermalis]
MSMNGIILIDKPTGLTSHDVVAKIRKLYRLKKVGHTGTLDPHVTGVLPICLGQATRISEYLLHQNKTYIGEVTFGFSTTTQDKWGEIINELKQVKITPKEIEEVFSKMEGEIWQTPPMYSAIRIDGKRLHQLAREGKTVHRQPRKALIYRFQIISMELDQDHPKVSFEVECSKGTYIRTLCEDIGTSLGIPAHMSFLRRTKSGPFTIEECWSLEEVEEKINEGEGDKILLPLDQAIKSFPAISVDHEIRKCVLNGQPITLTSPMEKDQRIRIYDRNHDFLAIYRVADWQSAIAEKVFHLG